MSQSTISRSTHGADQRNTPPIHGTAREKLVANPFQVVYCFTDQHLAQTKPYRVRPWRLNTCLGDRWIETLVGHVALYYNAQ